MEGSPAPTPAPADDRTDGVVSATPAQSGGRAGDALGTMPVVDRRRRRRTRLKRTILIAIGALLFLAISAWLARFLTTDNLEREEDVALIRAEARGDAAAIISRLENCRASPSCVATARQNAADPRLRTSGEVKILSLTSATANSPGGATGKTRVAWTVLGQTPVVQCVDVRRTGNALTGVDVKLLSLSRPIPNEADC
jgi:hypothetical protein